MATIAIACCTLEPRYDRPTLPVPDQWPESPAASNGSSSPSAHRAVATSDIGWREFVGDARLQALIGQALENNRDLRIAVLNVQGARELYRVQRAARLPWIEAQADYTRENLPPVLATETASFRADYYEAALAIPAFELDLFGRVRSLTRAALERYLAEEETRRNVRLLLVSDVTDAWLELAADQRLLSLARNTLSNQRDAYRLAERLHQTGNASGVDLAQARTTVESARADVARYEGNVARDMHGLSLLVGIQVGTDLMPSDQEMPANTIATLPAGIPSSALLARPDVLAAEHVLRAANADIGAARAALFPTISLTAIYGGASEELSDLFTSKARTWSVVPEVTAPIFEGGQRRANVRLSHARRGVAVAQYERVIQTAFREVADALALQRTLSAEQEATAALVDASSRAYELSRQRFKAGRDSYLVVLDSQRQYYAAQQALIEITLAEQMNRVSLYKALGGGWR